MAAIDQMDVSVKFFQEPDRVSETKVPDVVDGVVRLNAGIPSLGHCLVHFMHIGKWTIAVVNYIGMPKMGICCKPVVHWT
jgi:hypothetical protein